MAAGDDRLSQCHGNREGLAGKKEKANGRTGMASFFLGVKLVMKSLQVLFSKRLYSSYDLQQKQAMTNLI